MPEGAPVAGQPAEVNQATQDLLNKIFNSSNWRSEVERTVRRNIKLLAKNKELQAQIDKVGAKFDLETGAPKDGGKILSKDEAAEFDAFKALNVKASDLKSTLEEHKKLKDKETEDKEAEQYSDAGSAVGFENIPALTRWLKREKLVLEFKDARVENSETGKKELKRMPYVRPKEDEKAALEPLEEYVEREVPEFVDIFKTKPVQQESDSETGEGEEELVNRAAAEAARRVGGVRVAAARSAGSGTAQSRDKKQLEKIEEEARGNPLYAM